MQTYIINGFRRNRGGAIFALQQTGTNSGGYSNGDTHYRLNDFMCNRDFTINSVMRVTGTIPNTNGRLTGEVFTIGDRVTSVVGKQIDSFVMKQGNCYAVVVRTVNAVNTEEILITELRAYVAPVRATPTTPTQGRAVGNPTPTTPVGATGRFATIEQTIQSRNPRTIRLERLLKRRTETPQGFLERFFRELNGNRATIYVDDSSVQTPTGRRRSLGDIFQIMKYYYPDITLNTVLNLLYNVLPTSMPSGFRTSYCNTILKRVWYFDEAQSTNQLDRSRNDEFGNNYAFYLTNITR